MKKFYNHMVGPEIIKLVNCEFFVSISLKIVLGTQKNGLIERVLLSTHNTSFG